MAFRVTEEAFSQLPDLVARALFVLLAVGLVWLNPRNRAIRVFALLLALRGVGNILGNLSLFFNDFETSKAFLRAAQSVFFFLPFVALYFVSIYPHRRGWLGTRRAGSYGLWAASLALFVMFVIDPTLWSTVAPRTDGSARIAVLGPLFGLTGFLWFAYAILVFVLSRDYARTPVQPLRRSILLVAMGFGLQVAEVSTEATYRLLTDSYGPMPPTGVGFDVARAFAIPNLLLVIATVAYLARYAHAKAGPTERRFLTAWLALLVTVIPLTVAAIVISPPPREPGIRYDDILDGLLAFALPLVVAYALVKHQMFDIDLKIKWTIRSGTVAGAFVAVFLVAAQLAQNFFGQAYGWALGGVTAGLLLFALGPIQRAAERVANAAMPHVQNTEEYRRGRKADCYKSAVAMALKDRVVTREEERTLALLADELGISSSRALELREEVERQMPPTGRARRPVSS